MLPNMLWFVLGVPPDNEQRSVPLVQGNTDSPYGEACIHRLMDVMDAYIEPPPRELNAPFLLPIDK